MEAKTFLVAQRQRLVGSILGFCEHADWYPELNADERRELRQKVLDAVNVYHDCVLDIVKALDGDGVNFNTRALELLERVHAGVAEMAGRARAG